VDIVKGNMGWIEVVVGPMFSGKSEELIRRLRRAEIARQRVQIFKPAIDERYAANEIVSHSGLGIPSDAVFKADEIMEKLSPRTEVIGIDEAQFLGDEVVDVCTKLANLGKRVIVQAWTPTTAAARSNRCRAFWPSPKKSPSSSPSACAAAILPFTPSGSSRAKSSSSLAPWAPMKPAAAAASSPIPPSRRKKRTARNSSPATAPPRRLAADIAGRLSPATGLAVIAFPLTRLVMIA